MKNITKNNYVDIEYMNEKIQAIELSDGNYIINRLLVQIHRLS
jgi:hypothetical protein